MDQMTNKNVSAGLVHIVPFDIGYAFFDDLSINNSKSYKLMTTYIEFLKGECDRHGYEVHNNLKLLNDQIDYVFVDKKLCDKAFCYVKLLPGLYCYLLSSGVGVFVLCDLDQKAIKDEKDALSEYGSLLTVGYQKVFTQDVLLDNPSNAEALSEERKAIRIFMGIAWRAVSKLNEKERKFKNRHIRKISSDASYKSNGLSYVLSIYVLDRAVFDDDQIDYLLYSASNNQVLQKESWKELSSKEIPQGAYKKQERKIENGDGDTFYSWSAVAIANSKRHIGFSDILNDGVLCDLIKAEIYIQSRWFLGDNSLDNFKMSKKINLEGIEKVKNVLEATYASLDNETSANMTTLYKKMIKEIIETSDIKRLYKSSISQLNIQKNLTLSKNEDSKRKSALITNILMSVFTAMSLYKSLNEFSKSSFDAKSITLFCCSLLLAVGMVVWNFFINKR